MRMEMILRPQEWQKKCRQRLDIVTEASQRERQTLKNAKEEAVEDEKAEAASQDRRCRVEWPWRCY